jgi:type IV secretory pathway VirB2 component (pilin)
MLMAQAYAAIATPMGAVLCAVVGFIYGNLGRGLATIAVIIVGAGATLGKVSWGLAVTVAVGISVIFNAGNIVTLIGTNSGLAIVGC